MPEKPLTETVKAFRLALGDTQQSFATRMGWAISTAVRYESGRPPGGSVLSQLAEVAEKQGLPDYATTFLAALMSEMELHKLTGKLSMKWNDEHTNLGGFLYLTLEGKEQHDAAYAFFNAFMARFHPDSYGKAPGAATERKQQ